MGDWKLDSGPVRHHVKSEVFIALFFWAMLSAAFLFYGLAFVSPSHTAILYPTRMPIYSEAHPWPYLISLALVFAICGLVWVRFCSNLIGWRRLLSATATLCLTLLIFGFIGALWWIHHDIEAGFLPSSETLQRNIRSGLGDSPWVMLYMVALSCPLSSLALATSLGILYTSADYFAGRFSLDPLGKTSMHWAGRFLRVFVPAVIFQVLLTAAFALSGNSLSTGQTLMAIGYWLLLGAYGLPFILGLVAIAVPFIWWFRYRLRTFLDESSSDFSDGY